jgi:hypothetical protein
LRNKFLVLRTRTLGDTIAAKWINRFGAAVAGDLVGVADRVVEFVIECLDELA